MLVPYILALLLGSSLAGQYNNGGLKDAPLLKRTEPITADETISEESLDDDTPSIPSRDMVTGDRAGAYDAPKTPPVRDQGYNAPKRDDDTPMPPKIKTGGYDAAKPMPPPKDTGNSYAPKPIPPPPPHDQGGYNARKVVIPPRRDEPNSYNAPKIPPPKDEPNSYNAAKPIIPPRDEPKSYSAPKRPIPPHHDQPNSYNAPLPPLPPKDQPNSYHAPKPTMPPPPPRDEPKGYDPKPLPLPPRDEPKGYDPKPLPLPPRDEPKGYDPKPLPLPPRDEPKGYDAPRPVPLPARDESKGYDPKPLPLPPRDEPKGYNAPKITPPPHRDEPNSYNAPKRPIPTHRDHKAAKVASRMEIRDTPNPYGGSEVVPFVPKDTSTECSTSDRWFSVVGCYECEFKKCIKSCHGQLGHGFHHCANETALFKLESLFETCLKDDKSKCHKLNEDMALAFLISTYDSELADLRRREECLFKCALPEVMKCMEPCDPLPSVDAVDSEPIVVCYNQLRGKVTKMLHHFDRCLKRHDKQNY